MKPACQQSIEQAGGKCVMMMLDMFSWNFQELLAKLMSTLIGATHTYLIKDHLHPFMLAIFPSSYLFSKITELSSIMSVCVIQNWFQEFWAICQVLHCLPHLPNLNLFEHFYHSGFLDYCLRLIFTTIQTICPLAFFKCLLNLEANTELRTTSFI